MRTISGQWILGGIDPEYWFGLRICCLLIRNEDAYAIRLTDLRSYPLLNIKVSVGVSVFDDDGRYDYWITREMDVPIIEAFSSIDEITSRPLEGADYDVDCKYSDSEGNEFHETFNFHIQQEDFQERHSSLPWCYIHFFTQFGHPIGKSVFNPVGTTYENNTKIKKKAVINTSCILVLGPDSGQYISRLKEIQKAIDLLGYNSILVREQKELGHEALEQKLLRHALLTRFTIVEDSMPAGHIDELSLIARSRVIVAVLREQNKGGTWMQSDYDIDFPVQYFNYDVINSDDLFRAVARAVDWADRKLRNRRQLLGKRYPWR